MLFRSSHAARWNWFSPWLIIGSVCILAGVLLVFTVRNVDREKQFMELALLSEATVLMRSMEASSRTGMMGMGWGKRQTQLLMEETAQQPDVLYTALVTPTGQVVTHSDPSRVGSTLSLVFPEEGRTLHRFTEGERRAFEVVRAYQPWLRHRGGGAGAMCSNPNASPNDANLFILVGLDPSPFEEANRQDVRNTLLLFGLMLLVGAAGFVSLVWAQQYHSARTSLQDIQALTSTIINQMPIGLIAVDRHGAVRGANEAARLILKQEKDISGSIADFECFAPVAERIRKSERVIDQEVRCRIGGGETVPLLVNASVIRDAGRRATGHVFLFADMTNLKQLEEQLRRTERLAGLGRLAAGVAHEIRNPLSSIKGFATILAGRSKGDEKSRRLAEVMVQEVERLNRVVTELLDYARPTELHREPCSCKDLLGRTLRLVEGDAAERGVAIQSGVVPEDLEVEVDADRFAQVLLNLYLNALQAMEGGGVLRVEALEEDGRAILTVTDSGSGIPAEHLPHIFDPYFTTKPKGVGLGLANVHKFVEAHGGEIEVASSPQNGTCFTIRLEVSAGFHSRLRTGQDHEAA